VPMECGTAAAPWRAFTRTKVAFCSGCDLSRTLPKSVWCPGRTAGAPGEIANEREFWDAGESTADRPRCL